MPLYEERLINPLAVRFSQDRIWQEFTDGRPVQETLKEIRIVSLKGSCYDAILRPPFPAIEIIRLTQEVRQEDGERALNEKGRRTYGEESWFTFDNRRLYCLQRSALQLWPMVVGVVVKVLYDMPAVRCAKQKFRSTTDGCSVKLSLSDGTCGSTWNWQKAIQGALTPPEALKAAMAAVQNDMSKNHKEQLLEVPPIEDLDPGSRQRTTAERFNLGAMGGAHGQLNKQEAGQQLLSILHGDQSQMLSASSATPWSDNASSPAGWEAAGSWKEQDWHSWQWQEWEASQWPSQPRASRNETVRGRGKGTAWTKDRGWKT